MALSVINKLCRSLHSLRLDPKYIQTCHYYGPKFPRQPSFRPPYWYTKKERVRSNDMLTTENRDFIKEVVEDRLSTLPSVSTPLSNAQVTPSASPWDPKTRRCGLIVRKIGVYPMWLKNGKKFATTLLQVVDNHVIKYIPPEEYEPMHRRIPGRKSKFGALLVGAETVDPSTVTKQYCGLFKDTGLLPKKKLCRFQVTPNAALPAGTPLFASHFRVGDVVDVKSKTIDRGFQGVMKRWKFKGMPASHGVTKTHRRPGNIGGGGQKARVWPGKKMPGHKGNRMRAHRGVKILRINHKYNVIWTMGASIPGEIGTMCYMFDTLLPLRKLTTAPPFPTYFPAPDQELPEEIFDESVHQFADNTIMFPEE